MSANLFLHHNTQQNRLYEHRLEIRKLKASIDLLKTYFRDIMEEVEYSKCKERIIEICQKGIEHTS